MPTGKRRHWVCAQKERIVGTRLAKKRANRSIRSPNGRRLNRAPFRKHAFPHKRKKSIVWRDAGAQSLRRNRRGAPHTVGQKSRKYSGTNGQESPVSEKSRQKRRRGVYGASVFFDRMTCRKKAASGESFRMSVRTPRRKRTTKFSGARSKTDKSRRSDRRNLPLLRTFSPPFRI